MTIFRSGSSRTLVPAIVAALVLASCAGPAATREPAPPTPPPPAGPVARTVQGYRIQIITTNDRLAADEHVEAVVDWYDGLQPSARPPYLGQSELDVDVVWRAPYYRVQVGSFADRSEAQEALRAISTQFSDAFLVPATVTVVR